MALLDSKLQITKIIQNKEIESKNTQEKLYDHKKPVQSSDYCIAVNTFKKDIEKYQSFMSNITNLYETIK